jgi:hypothetical protein
MVSFLKTWTLSIPLPDEHPIVIHTALQRFEHLACLKVRFCSNASLMPFLKLLWKSFPCPRLRLLVIETNFVNKRVLALLRRVAEKNVIDAIVSEPHCGTGLHNFIYRSQTNVPSSLQAL